MRPHRVVVTTPAFNDDLRLPQRVEDLAIEQLVAQPGIKTLDEPVLPRTARRDVGGLCADGADPLLHRLGNELRAIIGTDMTSKMWRVTLFTQIVPATMESMCSIATNT